MSSQMTDVVNYQKGDLRRMLSVLAAIDSIPDATLVKVVAKTGLDKKTVTNLITQAREQAGVEIIKSGPAYTLESWGPIIKRTGAKMVLTGAFKAPTMPA
jgi:hypothetical protein